MRDNKGRFIKGTLPSKGFFRGMIPWNKGLKTGIIPRSAFKKGHTFIMSQECKDKIGKANKIANKGNLPWNTGKKRPEISGNKHHLWDGGVSKLPYPFEFTDELKNKIRTRDNYICQNCTMTEEEHLIVIGYSLTIHHIDHNKENNKENNLITLCQGCNSRANFNKDYWKILYQTKMKTILQLI